MAAAMAASPTTTSYAMDPPPTNRPGRSQSHAMPPPPSANNNTIKTPLSATYPNHIHSPLRSSHRKSDSTDNIKTPLTPPSAYFDFLRILSPNPYTPSPLSTGTSTRFSHDSNYPSPAWPSATLRDEKNLLRPTISSARSTSSSASGSSLSSVASEASFSALSAAAGNRGPGNRASLPPAANSSKPLQRPSELAFGRRAHSGPEATNNTEPSDIATTSITATDPNTGVRTTELTRPHTARPALQPGTPRLVIPPSPSGSVTQLSPTQHSAPATTANVPHSACPPSNMSAYGAQSATMHSAGGWTPASTASRENLWAKATRSAGAPQSAGPNSASATASPGPWQRRRSPGGASSTSSPVTVKHVVTRTYTYQRRPGQPTVQGPARSGAGAAAARGVAQSPLAVESIPEEEEEVKRKPLVGDVPRGKRRRVE